MTQVIVRSVELSELLAHLTTEAAADGVAQLVVGAVVRQEGKVLLLRRPPDDFMGGIYELPSGKVDPGEDLDFALAREVMEETGLAVASLTSYLGAFDYVSGSGRLSRPFTFAVDVPATSPVVLTEHDEYLWHPLTEQAPVTNAVQQVLADCDTINLADQTY